MTNRDVVERLLAYHPLYTAPNSCDGFKAGDPEAECTGIAVALVPTADVVRRCKESGCNLLITHEVLYYQTPDYPTWRGSFHNQVQLDKQQAIEQAGLTIWRDHDHMHAHQPDCIFDGFIKQLGWEKNRLETGDECPFFYAFDLPPITVEAMAAMLVQKVGMHGIRYMGRQQDVMTRIAICAHIYPDSFGKDGIGKDGFHHSYDMKVMEMMERYQIQAIIPGEIIDWTMLSWIRDGIEQGKPMACFNMGHYNWEELGMRHFGETVRRLVPEVPVQSMPTGDAWRFLIP